MYFAASFVSFFFMRFIVGFVQIVDMHNNVQDTWKGPEGEEISRVRTRCGLRGWKQTSQA